MSEAIKHECGIAMIRLKKDLNFYKEHYGSISYGLHKLYLMMEKQHNRGQDGAGVVCVKFDTNPGEEYIFRERSCKSEPIRDVFDNIKIAQEKNPEASPFIGNVYMGHLRYGTYGKNNIENVHPVMRLNNWKSRCLALAGNFNLTNVSEVFNHLLSIGQHPSQKSDTVTILENVSHFLNDEIEQTLFKFKAEGYNKKECSPLIEENLDIKNILMRSSKRWDGGYVIGGILGHGDAFVIRDPWGIRPAFFYDDEFVTVVASERPVIQTVFNVPSDQVKELGRGNALIIKRNGKVEETNIREQQKNCQCSFERIYFSRGSDKDIYQERKNLGKLIIPDVLKEIDYDLENTVFSFIPNTAEIAYYGMMEAVTKYMIDNKLSNMPRFEKIAIKDNKLRTFITQDEDRDDMVKHVYDITYGTIRENVDNLVIIDDSIVRGTTLKQSIICMLDRLHPKKIIVVSSAPQIRYPDCYGIDMARLDGFVAFRAVIELLKQSGKVSLLNEVYTLCKLENENVTNDGFVENHVKKLYAPFTTEQINKQIAKMITSSEVKSEVSIVFQSVENLHKAIPNNTGDWYFTGDYPTPGGNKVANRAFINFMEGNNQRAY